MIPRYFESLAELPRTPTEKVRKKELRERGVGPNSWDRSKAGSPDGGQVSNRPAAA
jgi:crotonobetaine/carnitine-CoA ligase